MTDAHNTCSVCGRPALLHVNLGSVDGKPNIRDYCQGCADRHLDEWRAPRRRLTGGRHAIGGLLIMSGVALGIVAVFADGLGIAGHSGFGWYQRGGALGGVLLIFVGAIFRIDVLGVSGTILFVLAIGVDYFGIGRSAGLGWRQEAALVVALLLLAAGLFFRRRPRNLATDTTGTTPGKPH